MAKDNDIEKERQRLLDLLKKINGKTIGEVDSSNLLSNSKNKGAIGQVIQKYLGKDLDNDKGKDFPEAQLELKVTGLLSYENKSKGAYHAKERLVLSEINYNEDYKEPFEESHVVKKCNDMLMTCYEYIKPKTNGEKPQYDKFPIIDSFIMSLSDADMMILKRDYDFIMDKIKRGLADQISQSDTNYLSTCTKAADSSKRTTQPFSDRLAKPRAFAFKDTFLTTLIKKYISNEDYQSIIDSLDEYKEFDLETYVLDKLKPWFGKTEEQLGYTFGVMTNAKNRYSVYADRIFKVSSLEDSEEFQKADISVKTIRIQKSGNIKEKMSFPQMDFEEVASTPWEESSVREHFAEKRFLFLIYKETNKGYVFDNAFFYNFTDSIIDEFIGYTYKKTQEVLNNGTIVKNRELKLINGEYKLIHSTYFVGIKENPICHVRPHARDFKDQAPLPVQDQLTGYTSYEKQCFWIDTRFIKAIVDNKQDEYISFARDRLNNIDE